MNTPIRYFNRRTLLAITAGASGNALLAKEPEISVPSYNTFTDAEEVALGQTFAAELAEETTFLEDAWLQSYVGRITQKLAATCRRPNLKYSIRIIDSDEINAHAIPGGFLYVQRGLLNFVTSECELAGVLAHEAGHIAGHHSANRLALFLHGKAVFDLVKQYVLDDRKLVADIIEKLGGALFVLSQMQYGRQNESEADLLGYHNLLRAGWSTVGMLQFFEKLKEKEGTANPLLTLLSTHPPSSERAQAIREELRAAPPTSRHVVDTDAFGQMKSRLRSLPPPPTPKKAKSQ